MILAEELKRVYKKLDEVISVEDNLKEFIEEYNKYVDKNNPFAAQNDRNCIC